ncbi:Transcription factor [Thalictrum thalictroides]|uniref:Transcription factor n=1 Tax=Thalictrum thalictroides TaxID=46969 RepID=A0A7J6UWE0_THATH|nr:Transcription factor [Thalictrum thalictroides]
MPNSVGNNSNSNSVSNGTSSFPDFFQGWLVTQRSYLEQLNSLISSSQNHPDEDLLKSLVGRVLAHYQNYYETKSRAASENVFLLFSPPWFSTFERTFLWIAGFKPGVAFRIVDGQVGDELTAQQHQRIQRLWAETRSMEKALSDEMVRLQENIVGPSWVYMVGRTDGQVVNGEVDELVGTTRGGLTDLVVNADYLRATTARELVDILTPIQAAKFLAAIAHLQLKIRSWGLQKDAERATIS